MKYWERYRKYLLSDKGFSTNVVNTMDDVLDTLTDLLGDPTRDMEFHRRGLIIGDVQSGKTANYTGLICKAADSGYKVIVLLTGTLEKLRQQTQQSCNPLSKGQFLFRKFCSDNVLDTSFLPPFQQNFILIYKAVFAPCTNVVTPYYHFLLLFARVAFKDYEIRQKSMYFYQCFC